MVVDKTKIPYTHSECGGELKCIFECPDNPQVELYHCLKCDEEGWIDNI